MAAIFNFSLIRTLGSVRGSLVVLPDLKNMSMAVGLPMLSCTQADIGFPSYPYYYCYYNDLLATASIVEHELSNELSMLSSIHSDFFAFSHSSVDISTDILIGRPFGGTVVLYHKQLAMAVHTVPTSNP